MVFIPGTHFPNLFLPNLNPDEGSGSVTGKEDTSRNGSEEKNFEFPPFSALPLDANGPRGNAWGLYPLSQSSPSQTSNSKSSKDELGSLNLLTPQTTLSASKEIQQGIRICTDWELTKPNHACFGRRKFEHRIVNKAPRIVNDDVVELNTQSGSQWDGFRHFGEFCDFCSMRIGRWESGLERRVEKT